MAQQMDTSVDKAVSSPPHKQQRKDNVAGGSPTHSKHVHPTHTREHWEAETNKLAAGAEAPAHHGHIDELKLHHDQGNEPPIDQLPIAHHEAAGAGAKPTDAAKQTEPSAATDAPTCGMAASDAPAAMTTPEGAAGDSDVCEVHPAAKEALATEAATGEPTPKEPSAAAPTSEATPMDVSTPDVPPTAADVPPAGTKTPAKGAPADATIKEASPPVDAAAGTITTGTGGFGTPIKDAGAVQEVKEAVAEVAKMAQEAAESIAAVDTTTTTEPKSSRVETAETVPPPAGINV